MTIESTNNNINRKETVLSEADLRSGLARSIRVIADLRRQAEQNGLAAGSSVAEQVILQNIPVIEEVVDGDLRTDLSTNTNVENRVNALPVEVVNDAQGQIDSLVSIMNAVPSIASANRLEGYIPFALPKTREGFGALQFIAGGYIATVGLSRDEALAVRVAQATKALGVLDSKTLVVAKNNESLTSDLLEDARLLAKARLPEILEEDSTRLKKIKDIITEQKLTQLRRKVVITEGDKQYSELEILIDKIIEQEKLAEQTEEVKRRREMALLKSKEEVTAKLSKRRAVATVVEMIERDSQLCEALAKKQRMTADELLIADEGTKRLAANNALNARMIVLSIEDRRVFNGSIVIANERVQLEEEMQDTLSYISALTDEEIAIIRSGIPKISSRRSVFYLAQDRLREQLQDEIDEEELFEALAQQIIRELTSKRCKMAVDTVIRDLGINPDSLLANPSILLPYSESITAEALQYLRFDSLPLRLPCVEVEGDDTSDSAAILELDQLRCLTERNVLDLLEKMAQSSDTGIKTEQREGVKIYMVDQKARETLVTVSRFLADLTKISDKIILPETEDEMSCLLTMLVDAITTGEPINLVTPICPDWSRNEEGQYDFKSLGGDESYIGKKFLTYGKEILAIFAKYQIPFKGVLQFADWGLETEITAKDTYGQEMSQEDIQMCFKSTVAATDEHLRAFQLDKEVGPLFASYSIVSMKESIESKIDVPEVQARLRDFFTKDKRGRRLLDILADQSYKINLERLGLSKEENRKYALQNLVEYATEGQAVGPRSILLVCESRTTSRSYNLPRQKHENIPVFFVRGKEGIDSGVNIL